MEKHIRHASTWLFVAGGALSAPAMSLYLELSMNTVWICCNVGMALLCVGVLGWIHPRERRGYCAASRRRTTL